MVVRLIGDSNTIVFDGMLLRSPRRPQTPFVFRTIYLPEFHVTDLLGENEKVAPAVRDGLVSALVLDQHSDLSPVTHNALWRKVFDHPDVSQPRGSTAADRPAVAFFVGHRDFARILFRLGPTVDFALPAVLHGPSPLDPVGSTTPVPLALIEELTRPTLHAFERAFAQLTQAGFDRLAVIGFRPPTLDDDGFEEVWKIRSRVHLRYKVTLLLNDRLAKICARHGVTYVDPWPLFTKNGIFEERFELDLVHVNSLASELLAGRIVDAYVDAYERQLAELEPAEARASPSSLT